MWFTTFALFITMCGLIVAAVELWHLLKFNEDVKTSKTKIVLCYVGFSLSIALALVCIGILIRTVTTTDREANQNLLDMMQDTLSMYGPTMDPQERSLLMEDINELRQKIQQQELESTGRITSSLLPNDSKQQLAKLQEVLPEIHERIVEIDRQRQLMIQQPSFNLRSEEYQSLVQSRQQWTELLQEHERLIALMSH